MLDGSLESESEDSDPFRASDFPDPGLARYSLEEFVAEYGGSLSRAGARPAARLRCSIGQT